MMADRLALLGTDLKLDYWLGGGLFEDADLATTLVAASARRERDLMTVSGVDAIEQAIVNRLKTRKGELKELGHPDYGSRHHELIGEPNVEPTRNLIKLYILQALRQEPRVERVLSADVRPDRDPPRETVRITITAKLIGEQVPLNLVVPFSLEVDA
jgi:phage baseplate assembly protein W